MSSHAVSVTRSLKRKLLLPLLLIGVALATATVGGIYAKFQNQIGDRVRHRAELVANAVNYAAESVSRLGELQRIVTAMGAEEEVSLIVVVGGRPARVLATTRSAWVGQALTELPVKDVAEDLEKAIQTRQSHNHVHVETAQFDFTSPLLLSRPELADRSLTDGAVMVHLDMRAAQAAMRQLTIEFSLAFLAAGVILAALGYGLIYRLVLRPVSRIGKLVEHRREGADESWAEAATDDELGTLARTLKDSLTRTGAVLHELEDQRNELRKSEARFRSLTELSSDFYWETDTEHRISQRTESDSGTRESVFHQESPIGKHRWEIPYLSPDESAWQAHRTVLGAHLPFREFVFSRLAVDGTERHVSISGDPVFDAAGNFEGYRGVGADITERKRMEEQVRQMAFHDTLTNLPNRRLLNDRLGQAMAASKRSGCHGALMFLDLDDFKSLNDTHGHTVGDLLLIEAAARLKSRVREMDTVARFGGDEFVVMIGELDADKSQSTTQAGIVAEKIRAVLAKTYVLKIQHEGKAETTIEHHCTASIGVALFGKHESSRDDVLKWADTAMYQAKEAGGDLIRFYDSKA